MLPLVLPHQPTIMESSTKEGITSSLQPIKKYFMSHCYQDFKRVILLVDLRIIDPQCTRHAIASPIYEFPCIATTSDDYPHIQQNLPGSLH